jgi:hypothetical protein
MLKGLSILILLIFLNAFCKSSKNINNQRIALIKKTIGAIENYDTLQLYKIVDTSYCFDIYGNDGFLNIINYTYNQLKICPPDYEKMKSINTITNTIKYNVPFCREKFKNSLNSGFDLVFTFANYNDDDQIMLIELKKYFSDVDSLFSPPIKLN